MISRWPRSRQLLAAAIVLLLSLSACGSGENGSGDSSTAGTPVRGGTATIIDVNEPRSLDPVKMPPEQEYAIGDALYGHLFTNDPATNTAKPSIGQSIETVDDGTTWIVKIKPNIVYSDGTSLGAADIKYNWEHGADPANASPYLGDYKTIKSITVVDELSVRVILQGPNILFPAMVWQGSFNMIAKPAALEAGQAAFDANPIGAGPFTLQSWRRSDALVLVRNPKYWDQPKPYLDSVTIRIINDPVQRYNALISGGADAAVETSFANFDKAEKAGIDVVNAPAGGGVGLAFNTTRAPFNDVRARRAVSEALNLDLIANAVDGGKTPVPRTLFDKGTPYYQDIPLHRFDPADAQKLFDQLAGEGKPLEFTMVTFGSSATKLAADSVQTQLSALKNVRAAQRAIDYAQYGQIIIQQRDFDLAVTSVTQNRIWRSFSSRSPSNFTGITDAQLDAALDATQVKSTDDELRQAYKVVQERFVATVPMVLYATYAPGALANRNIGGLAVFSLGFMKVEELYKK